MCFSVELNCFVIIDINVEHYRLKFKVLQTSPRNTKIYKNLQGYIFRILQHFAIKFAILIILRWSFLLVVMDFVLPAQIKNLVCLAGIIYWALHFSYNPNS